MRLCSGPQNAQQVRTLRSSPLLCVFSVALCQHCAPCVTPMVLGYPPALRRRWCYPYFTIDESCSGFNGIYFDVWKRVIVYERKKKHKNLTQVKQIFPVWKQIVFLYNEIFMATPIQIRSSFFSLPTLTGVFPGLFPGLLLIGGLCLGRCLIFTQRRILITGSRACGPFVLPNGKHLEQNIGTPVLHWTFKEDLEMQPLKIMVEESREIKKSFSCLFKCFLGKQGIGFILICIFD